MADQLATSFAGSKPQTGVTRQADRSTWPPRAADQVERNRPAGIHLRQDRVEHQLGHVPRMAERITLGHVRAVGDPVQHHGARAERLPQRVDVGDRVHGRVEAPVRPDDVGALAHRRRRRHGDIGTAHGLLQRRAVDGAELAGPALVEHDEPVVVEQRREAGSDPRDERDAGLAGAAGQEEQDAARRAGVVPGRDLEPQRARNVPAVIQRHGQHRAGEPGCTGARMRVRQHRPRVGAG
jgi:hypothetical protein